MSKRNAEKKLALQVSIITLTGNLILSAGKLAAGIFAHSQAMISDAIHSASDCLTTVIVMLGICFSHRRADAQHPFGHERLESAASLILAVMLGITGAGIGIEAARTLFYPATIPVPESGAMVAAVISIVVKEGMYWWTRSAALKIRSDALMADAWHHRSDALSSVGALIGIGAARSGLPWMDPAAGLVISGLILAAAVRLFIQALDKLVDKSCDVQTLRCIERAVLMQEGVLTLDRMRTRMFGSRIYAELEIGVQADLTLIQANRIAENVHHAAEKAVPELKHCTVFVNPTRE